MRTLFSRLFKVIKNSNGNPYEDFLTEIFAEILDEDSLVESFINKFVWSCKDRFSKISVDTQRTYPRLDGHETESRPDMVIHFMDGDQPHLLFIENKLESQEGYMQLSRYTDHLRTFKEMDYETHLLYITKYHDPKVKQQIGGVVFDQIRWYQIYNWLELHKSDFTNKFLEYLEEIGLSETRRFAPQDIYAIQHMDRLVNMMDSCLGGAVDDKMNHTFGKAKSRHTERFNQLRSNGRYMLYNDLENYTAALVGFYLTENEYPIVCIMLEVNPKNGKRLEVVAAMKEYLEKNPEWEGEDLEDPSAWSNISCYKELLHFLPEEDHINSIQTYIMKKLEELAEIKTSNPQLGWKS
jgi:hypothetical protein